MVVGSLVSNRMGMDVAVLGGLVLLMLGGVVDLASATAGFSSPAVLMLAGLFVVAAGIERTGAINEVARRLLGRPDSVRGAQLRLMVPVSFLSGFLNNTPIVAICLPIVREWSRRLGISPSHLFMPLSFAAILGGKLTLIGTASTIIVMTAWSNWILTPDAEWARDLGSTSLGPFMEFLGIAGLGLPCLILGVAMIAILAPILLPDRGEQSDTALDARDYQVEFVIAKGSPIIGQTIEGAGLRQLPGLFLSKLERGGVPVPAVDPDFILREDDRLAFVGVLESVLDLRRIKGLEPEDDQAKKLDVASTGKTLVEVVVSANSPLVGRSVRQAQFRTKYNAVIIAVHRQGQKISRKIGDIVLRPGDTLLLETHQNFRRMWQESGEFFLVSDVPDAFPTRHERAPIALGILAIMVALLLFAPIDRVVAIWGCALAMVLSRCATGTEARDSIQWKVLLVIAGAIGIGSALKTTGLADAAGHAIGSLSSIGGLPLVLFSLFLAASVLSQFITTYAAAALLFPVATDIAYVMTVDPTPVLFVLIIGVGCSFISPIGYQTNLMVYGPGGYRFLDYARLGTPLTLALAILCAFLSPLIYGT
ncbi:MAG: SLC13 family permease [Phycisphaerales bacterium]|nr:SLC13 family permease [Phycisphaerales bacterium]